MEAEDPEVAATGPEAPDEGPDATRVELEPQLAEGGPPGADIFAKIDCRVWSTLPKDSSNFEIRPLESSDKQAVLVGDLDGDG